MFGVGLAMLAGMISRETASEEAVCDAACVEQTALATARRDGTKSAVAYVQAAVAEDPSLALACHDIMHAVGAEAGKLGFPPYEADSCQYGYLHGVLQARAEADGRSFAGDASTWCAGLDRSDARLETECMHGVGHGVAVATRGDLAESLRQCATLKNSWIEPCANGAMMEHIALERQDGLFFKTAENGNGAAATSTRRTLTTSETEMLCLEAPSATRIPCYQLVWSLLYERYGENVEGAMRVCGRASEKTEQAACWRGFSTYAIELAEARSKITWPPSTTEEARAYAEAFLRECERQGDRAACVEGGSYTTHAGAYASDLADALIPPICDLAGNLREACQRGKERAAAMIASAQ
jgi:hypothetical protein